MAGKLPIACAVILALTMTSPGFAQTTPDPAAFIKKWDRSGKGMLDLKGVMNAAIVKFEILDKDHRGRLTQPQLAQELTPQEFKDANPDGDTTIGAQEWFALVSERFEAANPDRDGSLTLDELQTPQGKALLKLVD
jgi:hypothetical protein